MSTFLRWLVVTPLSRGHFYLKTMENKLMMTELGSLAKMTSREIASLTGKLHKNIMRDIREMEPAWEKIAGLKFELGEYLDENQQLRPEYHLSKRECLYIATKFNDEARAILILRWEQLETIDFSDPNRVLQLVQNWKDEQEKREIAEKKAISEKVRADLNEHKACLANGIIRENAPKLEYYKDVLSSNSDITSSVVAKLLGMTAIEFHKRLHARGIIYKVDGTWLLRAKYCNLGYTKQRTYYRECRDGSKITKHYTTWTEKGVEFIYGLNL